MSQLSLSARAYHRVLEPEFATTGEIKSAHLSINGKQLDENIKLSSLGGPDGISVRDA